MCAIRSHSRLAFTLIELLVVILVLAIIVAILAPVSNSILQKASSTKCLANLRQIGSASALYTAENNGRFAPSIWVDVGAWFQLLQEAGLDPKSLLCPAVDRSNPPINYVKGRCDYTYNSFLSPVDTGSAPLQSSLRISAIPTPSKTYLVADGKDISYNLSGSRIDFRHPGGRGTLEGSASWYYIPSPPGSGNVAFVDGHVEAILLAPHPPDYRTLPYDPSGIPFSPP